MIKIKVEQDRLSKSITVDEYIAAEEGKVRGLKAVLSRFVVNNNGSYIPVEKAKRMLGKLTLSELAELGNQFTQAAEEAAAGGPKAQTESTKPISQDSELPHTG